MSHIPANAIREVEYRSHTFNIYEKQRAFLSKLEKVLARDYVIKHNCSVSTYVKETKSTIKVYTTFKKGGCASASSAFLYQLTAYITERGLRSCVTANYTLTSHKTTRREPHVTVVAVLERPESLAA